MKNFAAKVKKSSPKKKSGITCVGCYRDSLDLPEYNEENPVEEDGTYVDKKFVCTACYVELIFHGLDLGAPRIIQYNMKLLRAAQAVKP